MWAGFAHIQKANPYHVASGAQGGEFTSASGVGAGGGGTVEVSHNGRNYTVNHDANGAVTKVVGHYKDGDYNIHKPGQTPTGVAAQVIGKANPGIFANMDAATAAAEGPKDVTVANGPHTYTVTLKNGEAQQIVGHYTDKNGTTSDYKIWSSDSGKPLSGGNSTIVGKAQEQVGKGPITTSASSPAASAAVEGASVKALGKIGQAKAYTVDINGKTFYASYQKDGTPLKVAVYNKENPLSGQVFSPHDDITQIVNSTVKESSDYQKDFPDATSVPTPASPTVEPKHMVDTGDKVSLVSSKDGDLSEVTLKTGTITPAMQTAIKTLSKVDALNTCGNLCRNTMTSEERDAVEAYQDGEYTAINKALAGKSVSGDPQAVQKLVTNMKSAMDKSVIPMDLTLYRGIEQDVNTVTGMANPEVGDLFVHPGYVSTSWSKLVASSFSSTSSSKPSNTTTLLEMSVKAGTQGVVMPKQSWEREVVLPAGAVFRVDAYTPPYSYSGKIAVLKVTYLGTKNS
jgi:hypothetical protein